MKIQLDGIWHEILGQGFGPSDLHRAYRDVEHVGGIVETYAGEIASIYRSNGLAVHRAELLSPDFSSRLHALKIRYQWEHAESGLIGPAVRGQELWLGAIALWLPRERGSHL